MWCHGSFGGGVMSKDLAAICTDPETAELVADEQVKRIENYHGPYYPRRWKEPTLERERWTGNSEIAAETEGGERVIIETRETRGA